METITYTLFLFRCSAYPSSSSCMLGQFVWSTAQVTKSANERNKMEIEFKNVWSCPSVEFKQSTIE